MHKDGPIIIKLIFFKKWAERCLFLFIFGFFNQILQQINVKHVQIVSVSWIISHGLLLMSLLQLPIDQDSVNKADFLFNKMKKEAMILADSDIDII